MRTSTLGILALTLALGAAAPVSAESDWLGNLKSFFSQPVDAGDQPAASESETAPVPTAKTAAAPAPAPAAAPKPAPRPQVQQSGNPADFVLAGNWTVTSKKTRDKVGSLTADGKYFTLDIKEPRLDMRSIYQQAANGTFRSTLLDKQVIVIEGNFEHKDRMVMRVDIKDIGKPNVTSYDLSATRDR